MSNIFSKLLLIGLFLFPTFALAQDTCYSVQLASVYNKNSIYFNEKAYPSDCKIISLTNLKAVRCGCIETREEAIVSLKSYRKTHHGAIIVRTYKSRFEHKLDIASEEKQRHIEDKLAQTESSPTKIEEEEVNVPTAEKNIFDKKIISFLSDGEFTIQGHFDLTAQAYIERPLDKHKGNFTGSGELEMDYIYNDITFVAKVYAQADAHDMQGSSEKNQRSFVRLDEFYIKQDFEDDQILFGKNILFWGALETQNITDVFNPNDLRADVFNENKLGVWNLAYTHYTETGDLSLIVKLQEQDRRLTAFPYVYYVLPETIPGPGPRIPIAYNDSLHADQGVNRPSFFIKYAGSTDTEYAWDYAVIFENGYDSQRYFHKIEDDDPAAILAAGSAETYENAYLVNKLMTFNTIVVGSTLFKVEAVYTDVISDDLISDYYHVGLGLEHTLIQFHGEADLGLIAEYYKYETLESGDDKYSDLDLFQSFQDDLFLGARYSFNQGNDASIIGGGVFDLEYDEQVYYIEYESRIADTFKINLDYRIIEPSKTDPTAFSVIGKHQRLSANIGYYF